MIVLTSNRLLNLHAYIIINIFHHNSLTIHPKYAKQNKLLSRMSLLSIYYYLLIHDYHLFQFHPDFTKYNEATLQRSVSMNFWPDMNQMSLAYRDLKEKFRWKKIIIITNLDQRQATGGFIILQRPAAGLWLATDFLSGHIKNEK